MEETSGRASPRGVIRKKGASKGNNVAEVDSPCIGQTESERNLEGERREKEKCRALSRVKVKIIRKFLYRLLVENTKRGVTSKKPMGFRNFSKREGNSESGGIPVYIFSLWSSQAGKNEKHNKRAVGELGFHAHPRLPFSTPFFFSLFSPFFLFLSLRCFETGGPRRRPLPRALISHI